MSIVHCMISVIQVCQVPIFFVIRQVSVCPSISMHVVLLFHFCCDLQTRYLLMETSWVHLANHNTSGLHQYHKARRGDQTGRHHPHQEHRYLKQVGVQQVSLPCSSQQRSDRLLHNRLLWDSLSWYVANQGQQPCLSCFIIAPGVYSTFGRR